MKHNNEYLSSSRGNTTTKTKEVQKHRQSVKVAEAEIYIQPHRHLYISKFSAYNSFKVYYYVFLLNFKTII
jgi:hypothetical protein